MAADSALVSTATVFPFQGNNSEDKVVWMQSGASISASDFGWKASNLCLSASVAHHVPPGFAVSKALVARIARDQASPADLEALRSLCARLLRARNAELVVRSSSCVEGGGASSFAGLFQTVRNVRSFNELVAGVRACYRSAQSDQVELYSELRGVSIPGEHLGVIVQRQVSIGHSALVHIAEDGYLLEAYEGDFTERIRGLGVPEQVLLSRRGRQETLHERSQLPIWYLEELESVVRDVQRLISDRRVSARALLETGSVGRRLYVLQMNLTSLPSVMTRQPSKRSCTVGGSALQRRAQALGVKGAAMEYFRSVGLFEAPLLVFPPNCSVASIKSTLTSMPPGALTVRFSRGENLGLPRTFVTGRDQVVPWISSTRKKGWAAIVHPYLEVRSSFELLLTKESMLLEHVPGMWESDNVLDPDVVYIHGAQAYAWRCTRPRTARFAQPDGWRDLTVSPKRISDLRCWGERLSVLREVLRQGFGEALPLNFHFVEDTKRHWYFLNIRRGFDLDMPLLLGRAPHIVREASDLESWDHQSPILVRFSNSRGAEKEVLSIAEHLPQRDFPLLIDFGLLSHPAMLLREFGFRLVPTYLSLSKRWTESTYENASWSLDHGNDPIRLMIAERPVYADRDVMIVKDRDPIVEGHLLVVAKGEAEGFAQGDLARRIESILRGRASPLIRQGKWFFVERGRARSCTSGPSLNQAHGHLLPTGRFGKHALAGIVAQLGAVSCDSLGEALQDVRNAEGEYVLLVGPNGESFLKLLPQGCALGRHHIRMLLSAHAL